MPAYLHALHPPAEVLWQWLLPAASCADSSSWLVQLLAGPLDSRQCMGRWEHWHFTGKGLGDGSHLVDPTESPQRRDAASPNPGARSSPLPLVDQLRSLHSGSSQQGMMADSSGSDLGNYEHTERHLGEKPAIRLGHRGVLCK